MGGLGGGYRLWFVLSNPSVDLNLNPQRWCWWHIVRDEAEAEEAEHREGGRRKPAEKNLVHTLTCFPAKKGGEKGTELMSNEYLDKWAKNKNKNNDYNVSIVMQKYQILTKAL